MSKFGYSFQIDCGYCQGLDNEETYREYIAKIVSEIGAVVIGETFIKMGENNRVFLVPLDYGFIHLRGIDDNLYVDVLHRNKYNFTELIKGLNDFLPRTIVPNLQVRATNDIPVTKDDGSVVSKERPWRQMVVKNED